MIEQRLHIALRHLVELFGTKPHQPDRSAVTISGSARAGFLERRDRLVVLLELLADFAKGEPGRGEIRCKLDRLLQQVGSGGQIALQLQVARELEAAVGEQVAGGEKQARGHPGKPVNGLQQRVKAYMTDMRPQDLLTPVPAGLCCKPGNFHIDPVRPVERAVITHGHSDHARAGHGAVLATQETLDIMRLRYGENFAGTTQAIGYGEEIRLGDVRVKFHPAGHVLGSAQIEVACKDTRIVASGDYKNARDPTCAPFEAVPCDVFITEATFGLPVFRHAMPPTK